MALRVLGGAVRRGFVSLACPIPLSTPARVTPSLTAAVQCQSQRHYAMRLELTEHGIIWRRPKYVPSWKPEKSGDLELCKQVDESRIRVNFLPAKDALEKVDDVTRQLLSLKFGTNSDKVHAYRYDLLRDIQRHQFDRGSIEVAITMLTVRIRKAQQELLANYKGKKKTRNKRVELLHNIDRRRKLLKHLRARDYKCFEWLIEKLGIVYRPHPLYYRWVTRKDSLRKLVRMHGMDLRKKRMEEYRKHLEQQQEGFMKEKMETLQWIANTEKSLGLPVSVDVPGGREESSMSAPPEDKKQEDAEKK